MSDRSGIEYVDATINPLGWGCYGPGGTAEEPQRCGYCYAHDTARRNLRECPKCRAFEPHWHPEQIELLGKWRKPRRILVESMGDLFGEGIDGLLVYETWHWLFLHQHHIYLILTKSPQNLFTWTEKAARARGCKIEDIWPDWFWLGTTVTCDEDLHRVEELLKVSAAHYWVSIEPLLDEVDCAGYLNPGDCWMGRCSYLEQTHKARCDREECLNYSKGVDWVVVGAQTGAGAVAPKREWIQRVVDQRLEADVPLFMKNSLAKHWDGELIQQYPEGMRRPVVPVLRRRTGIQGQGVAR